MGASLPIRDELTAEALRRHARHEPNRRAALRMLAIANALEGMGRGEAARLAGRERPAARPAGVGGDGRREPPRAPGRARQPLRDAVVRYNPEGPPGLHDRPKPGRPPRLGEAEQAALAARAVRGPGPGRGGAGGRTAA